MVVVSDLKNGVLVREQEAALIKKKRDSAKLGGIFWLAYRMFLYLNV